MAAAQRHGELIAHFSPECTVLREPQMVGIGWHASAYQAGCLATNLTWSLSRKRRGSGWTNWLLSMPLATDVPPAGSGDRRSSDEDGWSADKTGDNDASLMSVGVTERCQLGPERVLDSPGISGNQTVLGRPGSDSPKWSHRQMKRLR